MPTINASATISIAAGTRLVFDAGGQAAATLLHATSGQPLQSIDIGRSPQVVGPFSYGVSLSVSAVRPVVYTAQSVPFEAYESADLVSVHQSPAAGALVGPDGRAFLPDKIVGAGLVNPSQPLFGGQPIGITRALRSAGKVMCTFAGSIWTQSLGTAAAIVQDYTGLDANGNVTGIRSRTGQTGMLRVTPADNTSIRISLASPSTNIIQKALAGKFGIWVHIENQPGYQPGGSVSGSLTIDLANVQGFGNHLTIGVNSNQLREGWNFITFAQRNPAAYLQGTSETEAHPLGISAACTGTGVNANIVANNVNDIRIDIVNFSGATLTFDSCWGAFDSQAQIVFGCDAAGSDLLALGLPEFQARGWLAYFAVPGRVWTSGTKLLSDYAASPNIRTLYDAGWECVNHSANHLANGALTAPSEIAYELMGVQPFYSQSALNRANEFYASPQSSSSRLVDKMAIDLGFKLQRHARRSNVAITPYGIDNPAHVGAIDMGSASGGGMTITQGALAVVNVSGYQTFTKIKRFIDMLVGYGATGFPFWHGITLLGDSGSGEDLTGDNLLLTRSAFQKTMQYVADLEAAGSLRVRDGMTGFYYGVGR